MLAGDDRAPVREPCVGNIRRTVQQRQAQNRKRYSRKASRMGRGRRQPYPACQTKHLRTPAACPVAIVTPQAQTGRTTIEA